MSVRLFILRLYYSGWVGYVELENLPGFRQVWWDIHRNTCPRGAGTRSIVSRALVPATLALSGIGDRNLSFTIVVLVDGDLVGVTEGIAVLQR